MAEAAGISYRVHRGGAGSGAPPLLLIHGAGGSRLSWPAELRRLESRHVFAIDLPGHGQSGGPMPPTLAHVAERLLDWQRAVGLEAVIAVGHSMGGAISQWMALRDASAIAALILLGSSARFPISPVLLELLDDPGRHMETVDWIVDRSFASVAAEAVRQRARDQLGQMDAETLAMDFRASGRHDLRGRLEAITAPALILAGAEDRMVSRPLSEELAAGLKHGQLMYINGSGHMLMLERSKAVRDQVVAFLESLH